MSNPILITGSTGKQGGSVIDALLRSPEASDFLVLAVTRSPESEAAKRLEVKGPNVKIVKGDLNDIPRLFKEASTAATAPIWGVFSVQVFMGGGASLESEERQGKELVDESLKNGVKHFVYSSVDRGGERSSSNPTNVPHFKTKHNIEQHLRNKAPDEGQMGWTVLRPVAFMENLTPGFMGKMFATMWHEAVGEKKLQLVSTSDIGYFAAQAFIKPEKYRGKCISLAGDDLSFAEADKVIKENVGTDRPRTFGVVGKAMLWASRELGLMFEWFREEGYGADICELKKINPGLLSFSDWLKEKADFLHTKLSTRETYGSNHFGRSETSQQRLILSRDVRSMFGPCNLSRVHSLLVWEFVH